MKIALVNKSGSVGKTTLTAHLVHPRMNGAPVYAIEASNTTAKDFGIAVKSYDPTQFKEMLRDLFRDDDAILDIGGSKNFSDFYEKMIEAGTSHDEFDYFIVPVIPNEKAERESADTIFALLKANIPAEKIRVVYNKVGRLTNFELVPGAVKKFKLHSTQVSESDLYGILAGLRMTLPALLADEKTAKDYKKLALEQENGSAAYDKYFNLYYAKNMAASVSESLEKAWQELELTA